MPVDPFARLSLEEAADIREIGGGPRYGNLSTLRRGVRQGQLAVTATSGNGGSEALNTTIGDLETFREMWLQPDSDALSNIAEIERQSHHPSPEVTAWMAAHGDSRYGNAVAKRRRDRREKRSASTLKKLTAAQFAKAWREGGIGPIPTFD